jgi:capsular polysaccharide biosynthesis protein
MLTFLGVFFGVGLAVLLIVIRTWLDQTVRRREDVRELSGLDLLAVLPDLRKGGK